MPEQKILSTHYETLIKIFELDGSHIRTNMTTAGMTRERFFELMEKVK